MHSVQIKGGVLISGVVMHTSVRRWDHTVCVSKGRVYAAKVRKFCGKIFALARLYMSIEFMLA